MLHASGPAEEDAGRGFHPEYIQNACGRGLLHAVSSQLLNLMFTPKSCEALF